MIGAIVDYYEFLKCLQAWRTWTSACSILTFQYYHLTAPCRPTLHSWQAGKGHVAFSRAWRPVCSFMTNTAADMMALLTHQRYEVVHLDGNADEAHSFVRIVAAMKPAFARCEGVAGAWRLPTWRETDRRSGASATAFVTASAQNEWL